MQLIQGQQIDGKLLEWSFPEERAGSGLGVSSKTFTCFKLNKYYL